MFLDGFCNRQGCTQQHDCHCAGHIAIKDIGTHTRNVTHIIAHVIGDHCWVTGVIFRDADLNFTHQVCRNVCSLGVNPAAGLG